MTIIYEKQKFPPAPFDAEHEYMQYFRHLYDGDHQDIFSRSGQMTTQGNNNEYKRKLHRTNANYRISRRLSKLATQDPVNHYVIVNLSAAIAELPADLINRSLGSISADDETDTAYLEFIMLVARVSNTKSALWSAITQHQVDGGVAYRVRRNESKGVWFEWLLADLYFPHDDGMGADVTWIETRDEDKEYLRVERQRLEDGKLTIENQVYIMNNDAVDKRMDLVEYNSLYNEEIIEFDELENVNELMCGYVPNDETLIVPRGRSSLRNVDMIQEEINWTITRDSVVFEQHGKPKLAIPRALYDSVATKNNNDYGSRFVRNADLEVVSYDEKNGAVPMYITWDAQTAQSFEHVTRLIDYMMAISKTASTAVGLGGSSGGLSAKAILYEWIQSVIKAEAIREKFDHAIKGAIRKCTILENHASGTDFDVKDPIVEWTGMLPKADAETDEEESKKYTDGVQSLEVTVRNLHPDWSEDAIQEEVEKILEGKALDSFNPAYVQPPRTTIGGE
ncbi:phage portal protein [Sporosarcina jiandibaonis]|uniref:phage portal protein n=1 Tax=Sporosarcina jiandibaonis TaxID=2715535 RepID=UPI00155427A1|nr:phage portal protein [Sporosarcina jiandibaonis]